MARPLRRRVLELADIVVSHAGVGTILCAIRAGHTPVIIPRLKRHGEAVDDHQADLAAALANHGTVWLAPSIDDLPAAVAAVPPRRERGLSVSHQLINAVHAALSGTPAHTAGLRV
jgi:UDP-N-acetylglucosamine transferase subunit ALG13